MILTIINNNLHPKIHSNHKGFLLPTALSKYIQKPVNTPHRVESINTEVCATTIVFHLEKTNKLQINTVWIHHMHVYYSLKSATGNVMEKVNIH